MMYMAEERIVVAAKQQKPLKALAALLGGLGFTKISYSNKTLTVEKMKGQDIKGKPYLDYRVEFKGASMELSYTIPPNRSRVARLLELLPTFLNIIQVAEDYYVVKPSSIYAQINLVLSEASKIIDRDAVEFSTQLTDLQARYADLNAKYDDLVRSSEANTRILLECEQKKDELDKKLVRMSGMSDDLLREALYGWIRLHNGFIDVKEFAKANSIAITRAEEGLNLLIQEGYIRRRFE
jgi:hypothetical protein